MLTADAAEKAALLIYCTETICLFCRNLYVQMCSPELLDTISDQCQCVRILKSIVSKSKYLYASHWVRVLFVGVGLHCSCSCIDAGIARKLIDADPASLESTARKVLEVIVVTGCIQAASWWLAKIISYLGRWVASGWYSGVWKCE